MSEPVRSALIQTTGVWPREEMVSRQADLVEQAVAGGAQIVCLQELATGPYFCQVEDKSWFTLAEPVPDGPTVNMFREVAARLATVLVVPLFEDASGSYYNTAVVIDADGSIVGKYRKTHIPQVKGFFEKYYFKPGNTGFPVFETRYAKVGVYICYDRHFPEGARCLGLAGAEIVFIPSATAGKSRRLWWVEQRSHAVANAYFVGTINRVGKETLGEQVFFGHSYFCDPYGVVIAEGGEEEEIIYADLDLSMVEEAKRELPFYQDRRPETYSAITVHVC